MKRSSHEDSDVQRDVNIRVHEGAIDSVAMRMIMFKKESGAGENNTLYINVCYCSSARPPPPNFNVDCALLGDGCLKINTPFCNARLEKEATLKLGGEGGQRKQQQQQIEKECYFLPHRNGFWYAATR